jgi:hypothetical protein
MRPPDNSETVGSSNLITVRRCVDGVKAVTGHIVRGAVNRLEKKAVTFA